MQIGGLMWCRHAHINLSTLVEQYDGRMRGVAEALDRGGDVLPMRELAPSRHWR